MYFNSNVIIPVLIIFCGWIFSVCLHEWSHSITAYIGGDKSVKQKGYLSYASVAYTVRLFLSDYFFIKYIAG